MSALHLSGLLPRTWPVLLLSFLVAHAALAFAPATTDVPFTPTAGMRSVQLAEAAFTRGNSRPAWVEGIDQLPPAAKDSPLAIRLSDVQFHVGEQSAYYVHRALIANEASSVSALGQYEIAFQPDYQRVQLHRLRIVRGEQVIDKLASADVRFLQRETGLSQGVYSGDITAAIVTDDVRVGDTLEVAYTVLGQNPVFGGKFFDAAAWDSPAPVGLRRITLDMPEQRSIAYRMQGGSVAVTPKEQRRNGRRILRFEARDLPPVAAEPYVPADVSTYRWIQFSELGSWKEVNRWALGLFDTPAGGAAVQEALRAAGAKGTPAQQVVKVLEFVQNEIRYLSLSMGESSHRPFPPAQVLQRRYGDCKDKSLLMVAMLRELGIVAEPVLVSTELRKGLDRMLPSPLLFDHAIVRVHVDGKTYFLDPTRLGQHGLLDNMGQTHGGAQVLVVNATGKALDTIALQTDPALITDKRSERVTVSAFDQPAEMQVRISMAGTGAERMRVQLAGLSAQQLRQAYESSMGRRYADFTMLAEPLVSDDRVNNRLTVDLRYRIAKFMEKNDQGWLMRYKPVNLTEQFYVPDLVKRSHPLLVPMYPSISIYDFEVMLPQQVDARYQPSQNSIDNSAFRLTEALAFTGRVAQASLRLDVTADRVPADGVPAFVEASRKVNEMLQGSMLLPTRMLKVAAAPDYKEALKARLEASLKASDRLLADAALTGQDTGAILCERARTHSWLGQHAAALKDAAQAVQLQPQSADYLSCQADISFAAGKFKDSAAGFARAVALGNNDGETYQRKALANIYLGNQREMIHDLARAGSKLDEPLAHVRGQIWQAIVGAVPAAMDAGGPPELLTEQWLGEALKMFQQQTGPETMLRVASRDGGNSQAPRLVEVYFYAGKYYLLQNDKIRARVYFQHALDKGVLHSPFHALSRLELERL